MILKYDRERKRPVLQSRNTVTRGGRGRERASDRGLGKGKRKGGC